jgi:hypothetical protein
MALKKRVRVITAHPAQVQMTAQLTTQRFCSILTETTWKPFAHKGDLRTKIYGLNKGFALGSSGSGVDIRTSCALHWKSTVIETIHDEIRNQSA